MLHGRDRAEEPRVGQKSPTPTTARTSTTTTGTGTGTVGTTTANSRPGTAATPPSPPASPTKNVRSGSTSTKISSTPASPPASATPVPSKHHHGTRHNSTVNALAPSGSSASSVSSLRVAPKSPGMTSNNTTPSSQQPPQQDPSSPSSASARQPADTAHPARRASSSSSTTAPSTTTASSAKSGSFLSRFSLPLPRSARIRNIVDFYVHTREPHKIYTAGDHVRGSVCLTVVKTVRITHLTVALSGYVHVVKDPRTRSRAALANAVSLLPNGVSERPVYHGNGFASIFQDEQVLSGDGKLEPGKYEFGFDLVFPSKGLPSSIDFERGTISYVVSSTLTRPIAIAPTTTCETKIMLNNKVDIGHCAPPQPRVIYIEPQAKKKRRKQSTGLDKSVAPSADLSDISAESGHESAVLDGMTVRERSIDNDMRSEISGESERSVSTGGLSRAHLAQVASAKQQVVDDKTITAKIGLTRGGYLPGDTVTVRVDIQHIKYIKSMNGVIVTLFRQGKIDSSPNPDMFNNTLSKQERRRMQREDVPKSKTRLGGLTLSSANSTSMFRKDLDQATAPIIINPATLQASIPVSVKLPGECFPTIKGVPGDMMRFSYQVEVVVDLGGKLSNQFKGSQESSHGHGHGIGQEGSMMYDNSSFSSRRPATGITDTSAIKRESGVINVTLETQIGTDDSTRGRARQRVSPSSRTVRTTASEDDDYHRNAEFSHVDDSHWATTPHANSDGYFPIQRGQQGVPSYSTPATPSGPSQPYPYAVHGESSSSVPAYEAPPPQLPDQRGLSEKERVREAETRLLPSAPPAGPSAVGPSAPPADDDEDDIYDADDTPRMPHAGPSSPLSEIGPSAPTEDDLTALPVHPPTEDKQELERRRLLNEASAPPEMPDELTRTSSRDTATVAGPSAPVLNEEDEHDAQPGLPSQGHQEQLPAYER
ncbi:pH-response regulator protein-like protein [Emericellopsis cladophorae]|uniref:PH-response regulator protein-like protein n=1 Tax=Emericellopsis cladophorae TaxID=2686198 RepID=A0A9P9Y9A3_9HYPO|nr:pH-response regulator protein-like protein [Emericellopsis cladophorae]KAI6785665.1 pH-response regulator protein-like protein [Emericellopsis cladophorae]